MATQEVYEPAARFGHASFSLNNRVYVWGGLTVGLETGSEADKIKLRLGSCIEQFKPDREVWRRVNCKERHPTDPCMCKGNDCSAAYDS